MKLDKYQRKYVREIKDAKTIEMLAFLVNKIYEDGFQDGHEEGVKDGKKEAKP